MILILAGSERQYRDFAARHRIVKHKRLVQTQHTQGLLRTTPIFLVGSYSDQRDFVKVLRELACRGYTSFFAEHEIDTYREEFVADGLILA